MVNVSHKKCIEKGKLLLVIAPNYHIFKRDLITIDVDYTPSIKPSRSISPSQVRV